MILKYIISSVTLFFLLGIPGALFSSGKGGAGCATYVTNTSSGEDEEDSDSCFDELSLWEKIQTKGTDFGVVQQLAFVQGFLMIISSAGEELEALQDAIQMDLSSCIERLVSTVFVKTIKGPMSSEKISQQKRAFVEFSYIAGMQFFFEFFALRKGGLLSDEASEEFFENIIIDEALQQSIQKSFYDGFNSVSVASHADSIHREIYLYASRLTNNLTEIFRELDPKFKFYPSKIHKPPLLEDEQDAEDAQRALLAGLALGAEGAQPSAVKVRDSKKSIKKSGRRRRKQKRSGHAVSKPSVLHGGVEEKKTELCTPSSDLQLEIKRGAFTLWVAGVEESKKQREFLDGMKAAKAAAKKTVTASAVLSVLAPGDSLYDPTDDWQPVTVDPVARQEKGNSSVALSGKASLSPSKTIGAPVLEKLKRREAEVSSHSGEGVCVLKSKAIVELPAAIAGCKSSEVDREEATQKLLAAESKLKEALEAGRATADELRVQCEQIEKMKKILAQDAARVQKKLKKAEGILFLAQHMSWQAAQAIQHASLVERRAFEKSVAPSIVRVPVPVPGPVRYIPIAVPFQDPADDSFLASEELCADSFELEPSEYVLQAAQDLLKAHEPYAEQMANSAISIEDKLLLQDPAITLIQQTRERLESVQSTGAAGDSPSLEAQNLTCRLYALTQLYLERLRIFKAAVNEENPLTLIPGINAREGLDESAKKYLSSAVFQAIKMNASDAEYKRAQESEGKAPDDEAA